MVSLRSRTTTAAAVGGILIFGGLAASPAQGFPTYPSGTELTIVCDAFTYAPTTIATCTLFNIDPAGPTFIDEITTLISAGGAGGAGPLVGAVQQANTYTQELTTPAVPGLYEVMGHSGVETATTTIQVVVEGVPTEFSVVVNPDGSVTIRNGQPGCSVTVYVNGEPIGSFVIGADGTVTVPADVANLSPGDVVTATQEASDTCAALTAAEVTVPGSTDSIAGVPTPPASTTGANVALGFVAGLAALGIGGGLVAAGRRKKV